MRDLDWKTVEDQEGVNASRIMASVIGDVAITMAAGATTHDLLERFQISEDFLAQIISASWNLGPNGVIAAKVHEAVSFETFAPIFAVGFLVAKEYCERFDTDPLYCVLKQS